MLNIKNLTVSVANKKILQNISFTFKPGKVYVLMGPNGSGKSSLAGTIMGNPAYIPSSKSRIKYNNEEITNLKPEERAKKGIFMSFQNPVSLTGVSIYQLMRVAIDGRMDPLSIRQQLQKYAKQLSVSEELLSRSLNDAFSGGEKKKMEILQAALLDPSLLIFDEIDTGVDVDSMASIARFINKMRDKEKIFIIITHYNRILKYIKPDRVLVLVGGRLVKQGTAKLAEAIEKNGYENM